MPYDEPPMGSRTRQGVRNQRRAYNRKMRKRQMSPEYNRRRYPPWDSRRWKAT